MTWRAISAGPWSTKITQKFVDGNGDLSMTNRAELIGIESCAKVLTPATIESLGTGPFCAFPNDYELEIYLGFAASITPNDFITLLPSAIVNKQRNSFYTTGSSFVERPVLAPKPKMVVRAVGPGRRRILPATSLTRVVNPRFLS